MKKITLTLFFLATFFQVFSQSFNITGQISDSSGRSLPGAGIALLQQSDSTIITGTVSDSNGDFTIPNVQSGNILLRITFLGFDDKYISRTITDTPLNLGSLMLREKTSTLNTVNVIGKIPPVQLKGDTTQFNADAFKVNKDANAEDLAAKMPGITTQDGKVQAQGEDVKKVLIDGKPYLGDDPSAALKNLPAEIIDKIQVFDKRSDQSEFTGFNDGNTTKTINIITRPQFRNGTFGRMYGGFGSDDNNDEKWKSGYNVNFFKDKRKLTILGNANNINEQNFATDDLLGVIGTNAGNRPPGSQGNNPQRRGNQGGGGGGRYQQQNDAGNFLVDQRNGIATTYSAGLNYVNQWKKTDFSFSYFFNRSENLSSSNIFRQYITTDADGLKYTEDNVSKSENVNQRANVRFEYKFDTLNSILFQPRISFQNNTGRSLLDGTNTDNVGEISSTISNTNNDLDGLSFSTPLLYRHSFLKKGRTFSLNLNTGYNQNKGNSDLNSVVNYSDTTIPQAALNQLSNLDSDTWNYSTEATYTEPVSEKEQLSFTYKGSYNNSESDKITYSDSTGDELTYWLNPLLSNTFTSKYLTQSLGSNYRYGDEKWNLMAGLAYQRADLQNENIFPYENQLEKKFYSLLPVAMIQYKFTLKKNIRLFYRSSNNSPSVSQLQNVINNNNPLQLTTGNPDLEQDWQNNVNIRYSAANPDKNTSFFFFISGTYTSDYIANSTYIAFSDTTILNDIVLAKGTQLSRPVNLDANYSLRTFGNYSFPISILKSSLNINGNANYTRTPGLQNNALTYSTTTNSGLGFALSSNISEKVDFLLSSNGSFSNIQNTSSSVSENNSFNLSSRVKFQVLPWKGLVLQTDLNHQYNSGLSESYNQNYFLWNAGIGYKFLKDRLAELRLSVFDLLEQNTNISRNTTDIYYEDVQTNVLQQYYMLTFTYNLKYFKAKKDE